MRFEVKLVLVAVSILMIGLACNCNAESSSDQKPALKISKSTNFGNFEVSLKYDTLNSQDADEQQIISQQSDGVLNPEISIFSSSKRDYSQYSLDVNTPLSLRKSSRSDRYKNTIPAVFRVTVKGYSIMEHSNKKTDTWTLNKMSGKAFRKPEIMFSVTKRF